MPATQEEKHAKKSTMRAFFENLLGVIIYLAILYVFLALICVPCLWLLPKIYKEPQYSFLDPNKQVNYSENPMCYEEFVMNYFNRENISVCGLKPTGKVD